MDVVATEGQQEKKPEGLQPDQRLPALREDLQLQPAARDWHGEPGWTIYDPARGRFFHIGARDFYLLSNWQRTVVSDVCDAASAASGFVYHLDDVSDLLEFLVNAELLDVARTALKSRLAKLQAMRQKKWWESLLHNYLFVRVPLVHPDAWLARLYRHTHRFQRRWFFTLSIVVGLIGFLSVIRNWDAFLSSGKWLVTPQGFVVFALSLSVVKVLHELGHALMCKHYGIKVPTMGVALLVMWPVLYTDASQAWRLTSRRQRAMIAAAGVLTELSLAAYAMFLWVFLPEGVARGVAFTVATTALITSVLVNLNPLMRFDGYYFLSDILGFPNLQDRALALARWHLRKWLLAVNVPPPEELPRDMHRFCILYAYSMLVYRFFLFLGIALLVYHFFFKALGVLLFAVEIWWFIARPILNELKVWRGHVSEMPPRARRFWLGLSAALLVLLLYPWKTEVALPAVMTAENYVRVFTQKPAQLQTVHVTDGQQVKKGALLVTMTSPDLEHARKMALADLARLEAARGRSQTSEKFSGQRLVIEQQIGQASAELRAIDQALEQLEVRAAFDGTVRDLAPDLNSGRWLDSTAPLLTLVDQRRYRITAWASEDQLDAMVEGQAGRFYIHMGGMPALLEVRLERVSQSSVEVLDPPYQSSLFGGEIPADLIQGRHHPIDARYLVSATVDADDAAQLGQTDSWRVRGELVTGAHRNSLLVTGLTRALAVLIRESGF